MAIQKVPSLSKRLIYRLIPIKGSYLCKKGGVNNLKSIKIEVRDFVILKQDALEKVI